MIDSVNGNIVDGQNDYLKRHRWEKFNDIHCHCLPGLDDGPATKSESLALCQKLVGYGIATLVATPHQLGHSDGRNEAASVREAVHNLNEMLRNSGIAINIVPGGEIRVDERICELLEADKILTLADSSRYILLKLAHQVFIDIDPLLAELVLMGIQPIVSHAEKMDFHRPHMRVAVERISTRLGEDLTRLVCIGNPSRVINGQDILPVSLYDQLKADR